MSIEETIIKFCDNQIIKYSKRKEYQNVTYNVGYTDAMLRVREFVLKTRRENK